MNLNFGILGHGKMGKIREEELAKFTNCNLVAIFDPNQKSGPLHVETADQILENKNIDAIFICTPNKYNKEFTIKGLHCAKHVFCEKPPAFTSDDIKEIMQVEKRSGKKLMYGLNHRHHESIISMTKMIKSGEFGNILWLRGRYGKSVDQSFYNNWRSKREECGGGILFDQGIHMLDLFLNFADNFDSVKAFVSNLYWKMEIEDNVFAILKNSQTGVQASLHSTMTQWRHLFSLEIFLEKGYLVLNGLRTSSNTYGEEILSIAKNRSTAPAATWEDEERITYHSDSSWNTEVGHFISAIRNNSEISIGNSQDALKLMTLIEKIYEDGKK